ncbi:hypothetical protein QTP70_018206 [Hemibagrus guttatus]|uniref:Uncharacterized protein n=1 Tax=Hemibagrus guttatus TaxID=175788 RepID=A0AAE0V1T6_9TELE|nr:hypothetical protein QTP70_018206 [Hemibagrus guttatus]KAK3561296.1 hypothetical protein QTP86_030706 [Hemibagrus guttatus]
MRATLSGILLLGFVTLTHAEVGTKDSLKVSLKTLGISSDFLEELAQDHIAWYSGANKGFKEAEAKRAEEDDAQSAR